MVFMRFDTRIATDRRITGAVTPFNLDRRQRLSRPVVGRLRQSAEVVDAMFLTEVFRVKGGWDSVIEELSCDGGSVL